MVHEVRCVDVIELSALDVCPAWGGGGGTAGGGGLRRSEDTNRTPRNSTNVWASGSG
jgi:hypothetical protein